MKVAIIKYNAGNVYSVKCALARIGIEATVTDDEQQLRNADKVIFPGVGEASVAMSYLRERHLDSIIKSLTQPVLGICIGLQLLCRSSEEGNTECLGIFDTDVRRFDNSHCQEMKIPHMGWNSLEIQRDDPIFKYFNNGEYVYYVHSFYGRNCAESTLATSRYGNVAVTGVVRSGRVYGTQFHPEKSGDAGLRLLKAFAEL